MHRDRDLAVMLAICVALALAVLAFLWPEQSSAEHLFLPFVVDRSSEFRASERAAAQGDSGRAGSQAVTGPSPDVQGFCAWGRIPGERCR